MSSALQLQFFMVQAVIYSVIIVKINSHNVTNRKRLPWCELISPYNFFSLSMCFTIRHGKRLKETRRSFKVSASVSEAATSRLGLGQNFERLDLVSVSETWVSDLVSVSAQKVSCTSLV